MDRNQITGLVLMLLLLTVYFQFFAPELPEPTDEVQEIAKDQNNDSTAVQTQQSAIIELPSNPIAAADNNNDSLLSAMNNKKFGVFANYATGESQDIVIENDDVIFYIKRLSYISLLSDDNDNVIFKIHCMSFCSDD